MKGARTRIGITLGDPAGIGPEVALKTVLSRRYGEDIEPVLFGDSQIVSRESKKLGVEARINLFSGPQSVADRGAVNLFEVNSKGPARVRYGKPDSRTARSAISYIDRAVESAQNGLIDGLVTGPVDKRAVSIISAGFSGHTKYIADKTASKMPVMLMVSPNLKVIPLTTHIPLSAVAGAISAELITETLQTASEGLCEFFSIKNPRFGVAGLNPHAGEDVFGNEEEKIIAPAIEEARRLGIDASGPYPADSIFKRALEGRFDVVLAMYHDQGLIPVKTLDFRKVVNVTLGLPFPRTSPGHGVALDIAGSGMADYESMLTALEVAASMAEKRKSKKERKVRNDPIRDGRLERHNI